MAVLSQRVQLSFFYLLDLLRLRRRVYMVPAQAAFGKWFTEGRHDDDRSQQPGRRQQRGSDKRGSKPAGGAGSRQPQPRNKPAGANRTQQRGETPAAAAAVRAGPSKPTARKLLGAAFAGPTTDEGADPSSVGIR